MNKTFEFLKNKTKVNYVSTIDGDRPSCRPFGDPILFDNRIYVLTSKTKNVSKQVEKNNNVCIVAYDGEDWIRVNCKLIDDSNNVEAKKAIINEFDWAEEAGYTLDNPNSKFYIYQMLNQLFMMKMEILFWKKNFNKEVIKNENSSYWIW